MQKVILSGHIEVPAEDIEAVRAALPDHISNTLAEKGCLVFEVKEHPTNPGVFSVYEEFTSQEAFELHQKRVKESAWDATTKNVVRHYTIKGMD